MTVPAHVGFRDAFASPRARVAGIALVIGVLACVAFRVPSAEALLAGIAVTLLLGNPVPQLTGQAGHWMLKVAVVGLGAGINLSVIIAVGLRSFWLTAISILLSLAAGLWLAKAMKLGEELSILISTGTAICGGSAIAAVTGVIKPRSENAAIALSVVFLLNAVALVIFPPLGAALGFNQHQFGLWAALAIHDTSSVIGAALAYGREAAEVATTTKLVRALWIVPVSMLIACWWAKRNVAEKKRVGLPIPGFIIGFLVVAAIFTYIAPLAPWRADVAAFARRLFAGTLFLIGAGFSRSAMRQIGLRPVIFAVCLWFAVTIATASALLAGWLK